jgi:pSer/pThr/pTyr-binding forkhead associated (FHA) protein
MSSVPSAATPVKASLVCRLRPGRTERFRLEGDDCLVGRQPGLAITLPYEGVSRRHARIRRDGQSYWIENLSPAGTFVNGTLVLRERLRHLDVVTLGKKVDLLFLLREEGASPATADGVVRAALVPEDGEPFEVALGEVLIGRSSANNLVLEDAAAVSKVHASIERTPQQLLLRDLGSSNGTFVNGQPVKSAVLKDGDVVSFADVVRYRVQVERGTVAAAAERDPAAETPSAVRRAQFSADWKTRYDWDSDEIQEIAALQAKLKAEDEERARLKAKKEDVIARSAPAGMTVPMPVAGPAPDAAPAKPAPPVRPAPPAKPAPPARPALPATPAPVAAPVRPEPPVAPAKPASPAAAPILELRLVGPAGPLVVTEPGDYAVGRATDAALRVENPTVSRQHARIVLAEDRASAYVRDAGGMGGTRLNGEPVRSLTALAEGDRIGMGDMELIVRLRRGSA